MKVSIEEQSLRDGLQFEKRLFTLEEKLVLFDRLTRAGVRKIQVGSFVNPKLVPQMADTETFIERVKNSFPDSDISCLILNEGGLERAMGCAADRFCMSVSVSDTHSRKNMNRPAAEALAMMTGLISEAVAAGRWVQGQLQCVFGCVYDGPTPEERVMAAAAALAEAGASEVSLGDTTGMANPLQIRRVVEKVGAVIPDTPVSLHLHDTRGLGLANIMAGYEAGVRSLDASAGGLGGCPFVKGAAGNVATEDTVNLFHQIGVETGIDLEAFCGVVDLYESMLGRTLSGHMSRVLKCQGTV